MVVNEKLSSRSKILPDRCLLLKLVDKIDILDGRLTKVDKIKIN